MLLMQKRGGGLLDRLLRLFGRLTVNGDTIIVNGYLARGGAFKEHRLDTPAIR